MTSMSLKSKKSSVLILGVTALMCSRVLLWLFNDPEGPNLLVVIGMAAIVYVLSLVVYGLGSSSTHPRRFLLAFLVQIVSVVGLYFLLK